MNSDTLLGYLLWGDFGLCTMTPAYLFGLLFPVISLFHFVTGFFRESGIHGRISATLDKPLSRIGLSGDALLPLLMGFGCVTAALASLSQLSDRRERLILSALLSLAIPCSAQTTIVFALAFRLPAACFILYLTVVFLIFLAAAVILAKALPASASCMHPAPRTRLQSPPLKSLLTRSLTAGLLFIKDAAPAFILGSICVSLLSFFGSFALLADWFSPFTEGFLHLPPSSASFFLLSILKRDLGAAGLLSVMGSDVFTGAQLTVCLTMMTLFTPCFASTILLLKQEKLPVAISIWAGSFIVSIFAGKLVSMLLL